MSISTLLRRTAGVLFGASAHAATIYYVYSTGQSLSRGRNGNPALNTTQPFTPANLKIWPKWYNTGINTAAFVPLIADEPKTRGGGTVDYEEPGVAMANVLRQLRGGNSSPQILVDAHGVGGRAYSVLKRGASTTEAYASGSPLVYPFDDAVGNHFGAPPRDPANTLARAKALATNQGDTLSVLAMTVTHGETDLQNSITAATYKGYMEDWHNNFNQECAYVMGAACDAPMFLSQFSSWGGGYNRTGPVTAGGVESTPIGIWFTARDNPSTVGLVAPHYPFTHTSDGIHMTNVSYERLGGYFAKALNKWVTEHKIFRPVAPRHITYSGSAITAQFHVPVPPLQFDTTAVTDPSNKGFEVWRGTTQLTLASVALSGPDTVVITVSEALNGTEQLRYAYTACITTGCTGPTGGARGNLRDSDTTTLQRVATQLPNWAITFNESINGFVWDPDGSAPVAQTISVTPASLAFAYTIGGTAPASQTMTASVSSGTLPYTASGNASWLSVLPGSGVLDTADVTNTVTADPAGLTAGVYSGQLTLSAAGATNTPQVLPVTLTVANPVIPLPTEASTKLTGGVKVVGRGSVR